MIGVESCPDWYKDLVLDESLAFVRRLPKAQKDEGCFSYVVRMVFGKNPHPVIDVLVHFLLSIVIGTHDVDGALIVRFR